MKSIMAFTLICGVVLFHSCGTNKITVYHNTPISLESALDQGAVKIVYKDGSEELYDKVVKQTKDNQYYGLILTNGGLVNEKIVKVDTSDVDYIYKKNTSKSTRQNNAKNIILIATMVGTAVYYIMQSLSLSF